MGSVIAVVVLALPVLAANLWAVLYLSRAWSAIDCATRHSYPKLRGLAHAVRRLRGDP